VKTRRALNRDFLSYSQIGLLPFRDVHFAVRRKTHQTSSRRLDAEF